MSASFMPAQRPSDLRSDERRGSGVKEVKSSMVSSTMLWPAHVLTSTADEAEVLTRARDDGL